MRFEICGRLLNSGTRSAALFAATLSTACHPEFTCDIMGTCPGYGEEAGLSDGGPDGGKVTFDSTLSVVTVGSTSGGSSIGLSDAETASPETSETFVAATTETVTATSGSPSTSDTDVECVPVSDEGCGGETPWCLGEGETLTDGGQVAPRCVECEEDTHCQWPYVAKEQSGICLDYACQACELGSNRGCSVTAPFCIATDGASQPGDASVGQVTVVTSDAGASTTADVQCVECLAETDCGGGTPACVDHVCVACDRDEQCTDPGAAVCDLAAHECVGCNAVGQCARLTDTPACDVNAGRCVECTREEQTKCEDGLNGFDYACVTIEEHPDLQTCSPQERESDGQCTECISDGQCLTGYRCVPETYGAQDGDGGVAPATGKYYCMALETELGDGQECGNNRPFVGKVAATSEGGASGTYCRPAFTTCEAYLDWKTGPDVVPEGQPGAGQSTCLGDESCGLPNIDDGYCTRFTSTTNLCTYECGSDLDCPSAIACNKSNPPAGVSAGRGVCDF